MELEIERIGSEQVVAWLDGRLEQLKVVIANKPDPSNPVNVPKFYKWKWEFGVRYGRIIGGIEALASFGHITPKFAKSLQQRVQAAFLLANAEAAVGGGL
jgi:hypothetical protein